MEEIPSGSGYSLLSLPASLYNSHRLWFHSVCLSQTQRVKLVKLTSPSALLLQCRRSFFLFCNNQVFSHCLFLCTASFLSVSLRCCCLCTYTHVHTLNVLSRALTPPLTLVSGSVPAVHECHHLLVQVIWENNHAFPCIQTCTGPAEIQCTHTFSCTSEHPGTGTSIIAILTSQKCLLYNMNATWRWTTVYFYDVGVSHVSLCPESFF